MLLCFPELLSPSLDSETKVVLRGQNVSLICSNQNKSLRITYVLFRHEKHLRTHDGKGEPMIFNLSISEAHELGPYKCKAQVSNCSVIKYSREFNFTFVGKWSTHSWGALWFVGFFPVLQWALCSPANTHEPGKYVTEVFILNNSVLLSLLKTF